jgi:hypothetical protein
VIWRGIVFRDYDASGLDRVEVCAADGVVTVGHLPDEMTPYQARQVAKMLEAAANELEPE